MYCRCSNLDSRPLRPVCGPFTDIIFASLKGLDKALVDHDMRGTSFEQTLKERPFWPLDATECHQLDLCPETVSVIFNRMHNSLHGNKRTQASHQQTGDTAAVWHIAPSYAGTCLGSCISGI